MPIDFGLLLPVGPPRGQTHRWLDDLDTTLSSFYGIRSLWMTDHFFWGDAPTYEAWTVLAFLAARYPMLEVGSLVLGQGYRSPALLAKMGATLQSLTQGRFILGLGAGWKEDEFYAYGYPYPAARIRIQQLEDALIIIKRMWYDAPPVSYHGRHYRIENAYCEPHPDPVPPIMVGCNGYQALKVAAAHADWWNSSGTLDHYRSRLNILLRHCGSIGRDPATLRLTRLMPLAVGRTIEEARRHAHGASSKAVIGTPEQIIENIAGFTALGVDYFIFELAGLPNQDIIGLMTEEVIPGIRGL